MRRPQRRAHLLAWVLIGPAVIAGLLLALWRRPADPVGDLPPVITDEAR